MKYFSLIILVLFIGCSSQENLIKIDNGKSLDKKLIGVWTGERSKNIKCRYFSWTMQRDSDGTYKVAFFNDKNKFDLIQAESGYWWVKDNKYYELNPKVMKEPDIYTYNQIDKNTFHYKMINYHVTADCKEDYEFSDIKLK